jgi:hypothetical protein
MHVSPLEPRALVARGGGSAGVPAPPAKDGWF